MGGGGGGRRGEYTGGTVLTGVQQRGYILKIQSSLYLGHFQRRGDKHCSLQSDPSLAFAEDMGLVLLVFFSQTCILFLFGDIGPTLLCYISIFGLVHLFERFCLQQGLVYFTVHAVANNQGR